MTLGYVKAEADEDLVGSGLTARGWVWQWFGCRIFAEVPGLVEIVRKIGGPLDTAPDILAAHPERGLVLIEVVRCGHTDVALELRKLRNNDWWHQRFSVAYVDVSDRSAWWHGAWDEWEVSDALTRTETGSGTRYLWVKRRAAPGSFDDIFGPRLAGVTA